MSRKSRSAAVAAIVSAAAAIPEVTETVTELVEIPTVAHKSIRSLIMSSITAGLSTKEITVLVQAQFPGTAAATKSVKHIAWYRSRMKKDAKTAVSAAELLANIAAGQNS